MNSAEHNFLTPESVSRLSRLELIARFVVEGFITGLHKSPYHGFSAEFSEHRQYMEGDSLRYLDWKVFGRTDRMYIKRFEEETNLAAHIILDVSGSMGFQDKGSVTKLRYGSILAASLAYLMLGQRDSVGLVTFAETIVTMIPPRSVQSQFSEIVSTLSSIEPAGNTVAADVLHTMAERIKSRGLVILISDLILDSDELLHGLKHFRHNGHEVLVFHIQDPAELAFDYDRETRFIDLESGKSLTTQPWHIREEYLKELNTKRNKMVRSMHDISVDYSLFATDVPFEKAISEYLAKRKRLY